MKLRGAVVGLVVLLMVLVSACGQPKIENGVDWAIKDFKAVNQKNTSFGLTDLKGKVWIADFAFTSCADVCPPMTSNMVKLQKQVKQAGLKKVEFVTFSVDPEVDKPSVLTRYAKQFEVDFSNWTFLTGYSQDFIENFASKNFKTFVKKPDEGSQVIHQTYLYLVDQNGHVRKSYSGLKNVPYNQIIDDIKTLQ